MYNSYMYADVSVAAYSGADDRTFTYSYKDMDLKVGEMVKIKFGKKSSIGIIRNPNTKKPEGNIKVQPIIEKLAIDPIPKDLMLLADWIISYYCASASSVWQLMIPKNPSTKPRKKFDKTPGQAQQLIKLTDAQQRAVSEIEKSEKPVLLEGAMGSGKTEIYFHLINQALKKNQSSILLMPEIFLTKQMIERAQKHFKDKLVVTHSSLTPAQRRAIWTECNSRSKTNGLVVIGPRSALFMPLHNLNLIVIDEFHEQSYKQDSSPRYQTEIVAGKLAQINKAKLILGSATPSITTRYLADAGKITRVHLPERAMESVHPDIKIIKSNHGEIISTELKKALEKALEIKKMSLLYINRRGTAPIYKCTDCGHSFECPNCGVNLHFHADQMKLMCHLCGYKTLPVAKCPECSGHELRGVGIGTKAVVQEISKLFPEARIARIDTDSASSKDFHQTLEDISAGNVDIIIGTQMIGRGMDIANLSLVGMINADYDLYSVDFNSIERAFQLLTQTAGRAGRRKDQGEVFIQTSQPENPLFELIINNDFESFYQSELLLRKKYSYPPYVYLLKLECGFVSPDLAKQKSEGLINKLATTKNIAIIGPVPAHPSIRGKKHYWKLIIKSKDRQILQEIANNLESYWTVNLDPFGIS